MTETNTKNPRLILVSHQLNKRTREHIKKNGLTISGFVRKAIASLLDSETPEPKIIRRYWLIEFSTKLDNQIRQLAKTNYPSITSLIRRAVTIQLEKELAE
jgi:hypothetical protein